MHVATSGLPVSQTRHRKLGSAKSSGPFGTQNPVKKRCLSNTFRSAEITFRCVPDLLYSPLFSVYVPLFYYDIPLFSGALGLRGSVGIRSAMFRTFLAYFPLILPERFDVLDALRESGSLKQMQRDFQ